VTAVATRASWVPGSAVGGFTLASLPYGVGAPAGGTDRVVVAIGDYALDLAGCAEAGLLAAAPAEVWSSPNLNRFLETGRPTQRAVRDRLQQLLATGAAEQAAVEPHLIARDTLVMACPVMPPDFVDFYASYHHAVRSMAAGRPDAQADVGANWKAMPIGYHARSGTIVGPGAEVRRPNGQYRTRDGIVAGASKALDFELEVGIVLGHASRLGERIPTDAFDEHAFGLTLLNDWSARDLQGWESAPLGPFTGKSFATQVGPWVLPLEALVPFAGRNETQAGAASYLCHDRSWTFDVQLEAMLQSAEMRRLGMPPMRITRTNMSHLHWDPAQLLAHTTVNGASVRPGDLLGTGTVSGPEDASAACLLELTSGGKPKIALPDGTFRGWLQDGDEITLTGAVRDADGATLVAFGELAGRVGAAVAFP